MHIPILCTCGRNINSCFGAFEFLRQLEIEKTTSERAHAISANMIGAVTDLQPDMGKYLTALGFHSICCRMRIISALRFNDFY